MASGQAYRSRAAIWGHCDLPHRRAQRLRLGNQIFRAAVSFIKCCVANRVAVIGENPQSSLAWQTPQMRRLMSLDCSRAVVTDQCQHGTRWKKATRFASWFAGSPPSDLEWRCKPRGNICSRTSLPHVMLRGNVPGSGKSWTSQAEGYPARLSTLLASWLCRAADASESSHLLSLIAR